MIDLCLQLALALAPVQWHWQWRQHFFTPLHLSTLLTDARQEGRGLASVRLARLDLKCMYACTCPDGLKPLRHKFAVLALRCPRLPLPGIKAQMTGARASSCVDALLAVYEKNAVLFLVRPLLAPAHVTRRRLLTPPHPRWSSYLADKDVYTMMLLKRLCVGRGGRGGRRKARMIFTQTQGGTRVRLRVREYTAEAEDVYSAGALGRLLSSFLATPPFIPPIPFHSTVSECATRRARDELTPPPPSFCPIPLSLPSSLLAVLRRVKRKRAAAAAKEDEE
ncbi:hypothetical protein B0H13DRAFT_2526008 [Mycena leptocephala]|nr:hypothetical protein B0H13DRAFT_2526008 [Mycena leptocephala]